MTKSKTTIKVGRTYFGPEERRLTLLSIDGDEVTVRRPITLAEETMTRSEMEAFVRGSERRTYHHKNGEVRTRVRADDQEVHYITPDHQSRVVSRAAWDEWRKGAD